MNAVIVLKYLFAILFVVAGALHFLIPKFYLKMMPPYIPFHKAAVALSGVFEIGLGILLLIPQ